MQTGVPFLSTEQFPRERHDPPKETGAVVTEVENTSVQDQDTEKLADNGASADSTTNLTGNRAAVKRLQKKPK